MKGPSTSDRMFSLSPFSNIRLLFLFSNFSLQNFMFFFRINTMSERINYSVARPLTVDFGQAKLSKLTSFLKKQNYITLFEFD